MSFAEILGSSTVSGKQIESRGRYCHLQSLPIEVMQWKEWAAYFSRDFMSQDEWERGRHDILYFL
jgi:hypothetical protein